MSNGHIWWATWLTFTFANKPGPGANSALLVASLPWPLLLCCVHPSISPRPREETTRSPLFREESGEENPGEQSRAEQQQQLVDRIDRRLMLPLCYWGKKGGDLREEEDVVVLVGGVRGVDGPLRSAKDRPVLHPHPLLRAGAADAVILQAQAAAQGRQGRGEAPHQVPSHRWQLQGRGQGAQDAPRTRITLFSFFSSYWRRSCFVLLWYYDDEPFRALPLLLQMLYVLCVYNKREKHNRITVIS